ncbi:MAG: hypothetical protein RIB60_02980 [Phycisphaerales bacterium]
MAVTGTRVHQVRAAVLWATRLISVGMVFYGAYLVLARLVFGVMSGRLGDAWSSWTGVAEEHGVVRGVPMLVCGLALAIGSRWLAGWVVAAPAGGCARCGYETSEDDARCPECGYASRS